MALDINFENNFRGVLLQAKGKLTGDDLLMVTHRIYDLDQASQVEYQIFDLSAIDSIDIDYLSIQRIAELDREASAKSAMRIAVIVKPGKLEELGEVWAELSNSPNLRSKVCLDMTTARSWLFQEELEAAV